MFCFTSIVLFIALLLYCMYSFLLRFCFCYVLVSLPTGVICLSVLWFFFNISWSYVSYPLIFFSYEITDALFCLSCHFSVAFIMLQWSQD